MIFVLKPGVPAEKMEAFTAHLTEKGFSPFVSPGTEHTAVCLLGDTAGLDLDHVVETNPIVAFGRRITEPYKAVNRRVRQEDTVVSVGGVLVGGGRFTVIAGPCSVESREQIISVAQSVAKSGATILRGGAFKPRTSPYAFQGMEADGLALLRQAKAETGLPLVSEIMNHTQLPLFENVDLIQVGARNMQNFDLLKALGHINKPVLLKRGLASNIDELLMSAEYIAAGGNGQIILCERGIRTFETATRNTLDLSAVVVLKQKTHLPVIVDPSHASGQRSLVLPLAKAALAVGADGLMIEVHNDPAAALCDGAQSLDPAEFDNLMGELARRVALEGKEMERKVPVQ